MLQNSKRCEDLISVIIVRLCVFLFLDYVYCVDLVQYYEGDEDVLYKEAKLVEETLFDQFSASFCNESPQEAILAGLSEMHKNHNLLEILDLVQYYEGDEDVLYKEAFY